MLCIIFCWDIVVSSLFQDSEVVITSNQTLPHIKATILTFLELEGQGRVIVLISCKKYTFLIKIERSTFIMMTGPYLFLVWPSNKSLITYMRHHNLLWITSSSWVLTRQNVLKTHLENKEMDFKNGAINMQPAGYNGADTITIRMSTCITYVDQNSFHLICLIKSLIGGVNSYHD